jgi:hypothetical protein
MHSTVKRLAVLGALGTTLGIAAPMGSASAAAPPVAPAAKLAFPLPGFAGFGVPGFAGGGLGGAAASGQAVWGSVVGPVIITTAPTSFINTNNQVSTGGNVSGGQVAVP